MATDLEYVRSAGGGLLAGPGKTPDDVTLAVGSGHLAAAVLVQPLSYLFFSVGCRVR